MLEAHVAPREFLGEYIVEDRVLVVGDSLVYAALLEFAAGEGVPVPGGVELLPAELRAEGEELLLKVVVVPEAVRLGAGGVQHPVAYIYHVQQPPEFLIRELDVHKPASHPRS